MAPLSHSSLIVSFVALSESINSWARLNWALFAGKNYFDLSGVFIGLTFAGPLLAMAIMILVRITTHPWTKLSRGKLLTRLYYLD